MAQSIKVFYDVEDYLEWEAYSKRFDYICSASQSGEYDMFHQFLNGSLLEAQIEDIKLHKLPYNDERKEIIIRTMDRDSAIDRIDYKILLRIFKEKGYNKEQADTIANTILTNYKDKRHRCFNPEFYEVDENLNIKFASYSEIYRKEVALNKVKSTLVHSSLKKASKDATEKLKKEKHPVGYYIKRTR